MTVVLTGGTGFIGRQLSAQLRPPNTGGIVRLIRNSVRPDFNERTDFVGDLANAADIDHFVTFGRTLVHLACTSNPRSSDRDVISDLEQNLIPTVRLFERFAIRQPGGHIVFASTGGDMYSFEPPYRPRCEDDPSCPQSSYSIHKLAVERFLEKFCQTYGIAGTVLRIANPYGNPVSEKRAHGLIGVALSMLRARHQIGVIEPIASVRDYLHLDDLSAAFQMAVDNPPQVGVCRLLNVGSGVGHSIAEIFEIIERVTGQTIEWRDNVPIGRTLSWNILDTGRIRALFGWQASINIEQGIERLWHRILSHSR